MIFKFKTQIFLLAFCLLFVFFAKAGELKGTITDQKGQPLAFAAIAVQPGNAGTLSNIDGKYTLQLPNGDYKVFFQFLGYKSVLRQITITDVALTLDVVLQEQAIALDEVNVVAGKEDIAYSIMRKAIAMAPYHLRAVTAYEVQTYVKANFKVEQVPWLIRKQLEKENFKVGNTYVLESVNQISYVYPNSVNERVISTRSNLPPGSNPSISFARSNFYKPNFGTMVSPLSPKAFVVYKFKYLGAFEDQGLQVLRIKVTPRSKGPNVFNGVISIIDHTFEIHSLKFDFTDENGFYNSIEQLLSPFDGIWMPTKLELNIDISFLGAKSKVNYVTSARNYKLTINEKARKLPEIIDEKTETIPQKTEISPTDKPVLTTKEAKRTIKKQLKAEKEDRKKAGEDIAIVSNYSFKLDTLARVQPDSVWTLLRQMPLTSDEIVGYQIADSIYLANEEKYKKDSISNLPKFKLKHLLSGHTYNYGVKTETYGYPKSLQFKSVINGVKSLDIFNTVDGFVLKSGLDYTRRFEAQSFDQVGFDVRYALARQALNGSAYYKIRRLRWAANFATGREVRQFNNANPISNGVNLIYTLLAQNNLMKLYETDYLSASLGAFVSDKVNLRGGVAIENRQSLINNSDFVIIRNANREYTSNVPNNNFSGDLPFEAHQVVKASAEIVYRPWAKARKFNDNRYTINPNKPTFNLQYQGGFGGTRFDKLAFGIAQNLKMFNKMDIEYNVQVGTFITKPVFLMDFMHPKGNQTIFVSTDINQFRQLNYYQHSTNAEYAQAFLNISPRKFLLSRINYLQFMGLSEQLFLNSWFINNYHYVETGYRIDGILRLFGLDVWAGFPKVGQTTFGASIKVPF